MCRKPATHRVGNTKAITNQLAKRWRMVATSKSRAAFRMKLSANYVNADTMCVSTSAVTAVIKRLRSRCTMASAFTSARANRERMDKRRVTDLRDHQISAAREFSGEHRLLACHISAACRDACELRQ